MKNFIKAICLICCLSLVLSVCAACGNDSNKPTFKKPTYVVGATSNITVDDTVENDRWKMVFDPETANIMVTDKLSGEIYSQIPYEYYTENRESLKKAENTFTPGTPVPEIPTDHKSIPLFSPLYITAVAISSNAVTTYYANTEVLLRGRVGSTLIENGIRVTYYFDALSISVPVEYTIDEDSFNVQVVPAEVCEADNENRILTAAISPMLCSAKNEDDGSYILLPSGSGAIMYTKNRSDGKALTYSAEVYGDDPAVEMYEKLSNPEELRLPMFGMVDGDNAVCAIIESGAEKCTVYAQTSDLMTGYSSAYISFRVRGYNKPVSTILAGRIRIRTHIVDDITSTEPIKISYTTLSGDKANYVGIAECYRDYLINEKGLGTSAESQLIYAQLLGGYQSDELFLGLPYKDTKSLTDYEDAATIVEKLSSMSDKSLTVNMVGFGTSGIELGALGGGFKLNGANGGNGAIKNFIAASKEAGANTYFDFDIVRFESGSAGLGKTAVTANNAAAKQYKYNTSTKIRDLENYHYLLQRAQLQKAADKAVSVVDKYDLNTISLGTLGNHAYSDYVQMEYYNKEGMGTQVSGIIAGIKENGKSVLVNEANDYAAVVADVILDVPTKSDMNAVFDQDIPFYQIVFKGYVNFANDSINTAENERREFLKAIETGTGLSFTLTNDYSVNTILSGESVFYATKFEDNQPRIEALVNESAGYLNAVKNAKITAHTTQNGVTKTVFDNGVTVYVNYGTAEVSVDGQTIAAEDFVALTGEGKVIG